MKFGIFCGKLIAYSHTPRSASGCQISVGSHLQKSVAINATSMLLRGGCAATVFSGGGSRSGTFPPFFRSATADVATFLNASITASTIDDDSSDFAEPTAYSAPST